MPTARHTASGPVPPARSGSADLQLLSHARYVLGAVEHALGALPEELGPDWQPSVDAIRSCFENLDPNGLRLTVAFLDHLVGYLDLDGAFHGRLLLTAGDHFARAGLTRDAVVAALDPDLRRRWDAVGYLVAGLPRADGTEDRTA